MDMFEPQDHPDDIPYPGGPPRPPYDVTGYNLAYSMGIKFDRILDALRRTVREARRRRRRSPPGKVAPRAAPDGGYLLSHEVNDAFVAVNRLLKANEEVSLAEVAVRGQRQDAIRPARCIIPAKATTLPILQKLAADKGLSFEAVAAEAGGRRDEAEAGAHRPVGSVRRLDAVRLDALAVRAVRVPVRGRLSAARSTPAICNAKFDVLVFVDGGIPAARRRGRRRRRVRRAADGRAIPAEFRDWLGRVTRREDRARAEEVRRERRHRARRSVRRPRSAITSDCRFTTRWSSGSPAASSGRCRARSSTSRARSSRRGSTPTHPLAYGMREHGDVFCDESPAFRLQPEAALEGVKPVAWFDSPTPLRSGWAWGQQYLDQAVAIVEAPLGNGRVVLFGPEIAVARAAARHLQVVLQRHLLRQRHAGAERRDGRPSRAVRRGLRFGTRLRTRDSDLDTSVEDSRRWNDSTTSGVASPRPTIRAPMKRFVLCRQPRCFCIVDSPQAQQSKPGLTPATPPAKPPANADTAQSSRKRWRPTSIRGALFTAADGRSGLQLRRARLPGVRDLEVPHRHPREERLHDRARRRRHSDGVGGDAGVAGKPVIALGSDIDGIPQASQKPGVAYHEPIIEGAPGHGEGTTPACR